MTVPRWNPDACIQCNRCAMACPHAAIRAYLVDEEEAAAAPAAFTTVPAKGAKGLQYRLQVSTLDCTGCGSCAASCLAKDKALTMQPVDDTMYDETNWNYALSLKDKPGVFDRKTLKGSQFSQPLVEFSGACAGCGETPYAKLITQLYGEKTYWVNGVGCSLAWAGAFPSLPYTKNKEGRGPAFYGTLFEDQAENGLGVVLATKQRRAYVKQVAQQLLPLVPGTELETAINAWLSSFDDLDANDADARKLTAALESASLTGEAAELAEKISKYARVKLDDSDNAPGWKFSQWEMKGVPLRLEIGPKDLEKNQCVLVRRDTREKVFVSLEELETAIPAQLEALRKDLYERALANREKRTWAATTMDEVKELAKANTGYIKTMWCGDLACEMKMKEEAGLSSRCMPFEQEHLSDVCPCCGKPASKMVYWGVAY